MSNDDENGRFLENQFHMIPFILLCPFLEVSSRTVASTCRAFELQVHYG